MHARRVRFLRRVLDERLCTHCGFCKDSVPCPSPTSCIGCGACYRACPQQAIRMLNDPSRHGTIELQVDGTRFEVPDRITVLTALELAGHAAAVFPGEAGIFAPCRVGGCFSCAVLVDGVAVRSCVTQVRNGMEIRTKLPTEFAPERIVHGPEPHSVGGKATPWQLKTMRSYVEVAIWTAGCNLSCPQCQNYHVTYDGLSDPLTPVQAARLVTAARRRYGVDRMAISGSEPTLNRRWLISYFKELAKLNPDSSAPLHLDSNGTILTKAYLDELIQDASVTDIGIEPKGASVETFMRITNVKHRELAQRYLATAWEAIKHTIDNYAAKVFLGVGLPYNEALISHEEVVRFGERLASMDPAVQLCVLDYFPTFRRRDIRRPKPDEMLKVKKLLEGTGLKNVVVQTSKGHFGPSG